MRAEPRRRACVSALALAAATALLAGCTSDDGPAPTPTATTPTTTPSGPTFDDAAPAIDLLLPTQEPVTLNDVDLVAAVSGHADEGRLGVTADDGFDASEILQPGETIEVPGWGVVGIVAVERLGDSGGDDGPAMPNPTGNVHLRAQLAGPYTLTGRSLPDDVVIEPTADGATVTIGEGDPILLTEARSTRDLEWGSVQLVPTDAGAEQPWRVEVRIAD